MSSEPGDQSNDRRLVYVAPIKVFGAGKIIKFVAEDSVTSGCKKMKYEFGGGEIPDDCRAASPPGFGKTLHQSADSKEQTVDSQQ